jgi:hypothetical protein
VLEKRLPSSIDDRFAAIQLARFAATKGGALH